MANFTHQSPKISLFDIELAFEAPKNYLSELYNRFDISQGTIPMVQSMDMGLRWVLEAKIVLKQPILAIRHMTDLSYYSHKIGIFYIELADKTPKI